MPNPPKRQATDEVPPPAFDMRESLHSSSAPTSAQIGFGCIPRCFQRDGVRSSPPAPTWANPDEPPTPSQSARKLAAAMRRRKTTENSDPNVMSPGQYLHEQMSYCIADSDFDHLGSGNSCLATFSRVGRRRRIERPHVVECLAHDDVFDPKALAIALECHGDVLSCFQLAVAFFFGAASGDGSCLDCSNCRSSSAGRASLNWLSIF